MFQITMEAWTFIAWRSRNSYCYLSSEWRGQKVVERNADIAAAPASKPGVRAFLRVEAKSGCNSMETAISSDEE